ARRYWKEYFSQLGVNQNRRENNEIQKTLNAVSKFISGIILRWILYHNLSPYHGFLHEPTNYPSLVYDLMEPYRGYFDKIVFDIYKKNIDSSNNQEKNQTLLLPKSIEQIKDFLDKKIYVHSTRQIATFQEILHGIVLALRVYLNKETKRFIVPFPEKPNGGRPINAGFKLYGHTAGVTDFWTQAKKISLDFLTIQD
ncbi:MAG: CRISPR-associated endonuclease Cas1, partial [Patescibacteria group bacterium]|nr:CRISPR-associated endonuclease Cas1 [Patescibacteria group bacterium]